MEAKQSAFSFIKGPIRIEIPYFQRGYVWNKDNWTDLIEELSDDKVNHFLGSIILKAIKVPSGEIPRWSLIDGQQRLTTLSILFRACYDSLPIESYPNDLQVEVKHVMQEMLFYKKQSLSTGRFPKIQHSYVDTKSFVAVIKGEYKDKLDNIILNEESSKKVKESDNILQCYKFFCQYLQKFGNDLVKKIWELLTNENLSLVVKIDLEESENEQAIFDTVNSSGVRLTCADTIKNSIFQFAVEKLNPLSNSTIVIEDSIHTLKTEEDILAIYRETWEKCFCCDTDTINYWSQHRLQGRMTRDNLEILLHCIALIKNIFDPEKNRISDLSQLYKDYAKRLSIEDLINFILEICSYAKMYKDCFYTFNGETHFSYDKRIQRLFHILSVCDVSTFHAYILKLLNSQQDLSEENLSDEISSELYNLEILTIRSLICGSSIKNFNKYCAELLSGKTTTAKLLEDKKSDLDDQILTQKVKNISNKFATLILFWLELKRRSTDNNCTEKELKYDYTLEHIMPQKWNEYWPIKNPIVKDYDGKQWIDVLDEEKAEELRAASIYEIGNMALLNSRLNTSIRNNTFDIKINGKDKANGKGKIYGISNYDYLLYTKDITNIYNSIKRWDEEQIHKRTKELTQSIIEIWPIKQTD